MKTFMSLLACFLVSVSLMAQVSDTEKTALLALYNATQGEQWTHTWDVSTPVDQWYGVTVENGTVVRLELSQNNLKGILPESISGLQNLQVLNLGFNSLKGSLPTSIGNMKSLKQIELFMNRFSGSIPSEIGKLSQLETLSLYSNQLSGELPKELYQLLSLKELHLK